MNAFESLLRHRTKPEDGSDAYRIYMAHAAENESRTPVRDAVICPVCRDRVSAPGSDICAACEIERKAGYRICMSTGRRTERSRGGEVWHAVNAPDGRLDRQSVCGYTLGSRSDWSTWKGANPAELKVTCPKCFRKLAHG